MNYTGKISFNRPFTSFPGGILLPMQDTRVQSLGWKDPLEEEMPTHSSIPAWKIPLAEEPGRLYSKGSKRVRHNWTCMTMKKSKVTSIFWFSSVQSLSRVRLFATPWTVACQAPLSMGFSRQEYWSGLAFPSPGDLPDPGIGSGSPALQADSLLSEP